MRRRIGLLAICSGSLMLLASVLIFHLAAPVATTAIAAIISTGSPASDIESRVVHTSLHAVRETKTKEITYTVTRPVREQVSRTVTYTQMTVVREQRSKIDPKTGNEVTYNVTRYVPEQREKVLNYLITKMVSEQKQKTVQYQTVRYEAASVPQIQPGGNQ